jgi:hypothetical protein
LRQPFTGDGLQKQYDLAPNLLGRKNILMQLRVQRLFFDKKAYTYNA